MSSAECKKCSGELEYWDEGVCGETELWSCESCKSVIVVPITIQRHFDAADWSCLND